MEKTKIDKMIEEAFELQFEPYGADEIIVFVDKAYGAGRMPFVCFDLEKKIITTEYVSLDYFKLNLLMKKVQELKWDSVNEQW